MNDQSGSRRVIGTLALAAAFFGVAQISYAKPGRVGGQNYASGRIPQEIKDSGIRTYRSITVEGEEIEFSGGFTDLHTRSYDEVIAGSGFRIEEARTAIEIVHNIRHAEAIGLKGEYHPFCKKPVILHPFDVKKEIEELLIEYGAKE